MSHYIYIAVVGADLADRPFGIVEDLQVIADFSEYLKDRAPDKQVKSYAGVEIVSETKKINHHIILDFSNLVGLRTEEILPSDP